MAAQTRTTVTLRDGRSLEVLLAGEEGSPAFLFHHGTPGSAFHLPFLVDAVVARGWRYVAASRSGYGGSDREPARAVAAAASDSLQLLDALRIDRFTTAGWSGGGPHALACAAALPGRCAAALSIAGVAPYVPDDLDWTAGMAEENVREFELSLAGGPEYDELLEGFRELLVALDPTKVTSARELFGDLVCDADEAAAPPAFVEGLLEMVQRGVGPGVGGWRDDDQAFLKDWGIDVGAISVPVGVWFGDDDLMVPWTHGEWLAERIPGARRHRLAGEGHFSFLVNGLADLLDELASLAGPPW